jgi:hypothetical protein
LNYIEKSYLDKIGPYLTNFQPKSDDLWNCKCPYCGDSSKNSRKTRGYFFTGTDDNCVYSCRNCDITVPLAQFLKDHFPSYHSQFKLDMFSKKEQKLVIKPVKKEPDKRIQTLRQKIRTIPGSYVSISELDKSHKARQYIDGRDLPDISDLGYVDDFCRYVAEMTNNHERYEKLPKDARIIIPLKLPDGTLIGFQGRAVNDSGMRYITIKIPDMSDDYVKIYGLDRFNKDKFGFVVEGPFDSKFLPNCIAMCGASLDMNVVKRELIIPEKTIVVIDNEPRNKQIVERMYAYTDAGFRIYVPPVNLNTIHKDINKMYQNGWTKSQLVELFLKNSHTSIKAKLAINQWKRV